MRGRITIELKCGSNFLRELLGLLGVLGDTATNRALPRVDQALPMVKGSQLRGHAGSCSLGRRVWDE